MDNNTPSFSPMAMNRRPKAKRSSGGGSHKSSGRSVATGAASTVGDGGTNKRSRPPTLDLAASKRRVHTDNDDEHIDSSDEDNDDDNRLTNGTHNNRTGNDDASSSEEENIDVKKVRLAREYLAGLDTAPDDNDDDNDNDNDDETGTAENAATASYDAVSRRLQRERLVRHGALQRECAETVTASLQDMHEQCRRRWHLSRATAAVASSTTTTTTTVDDWIQAGHVTFLPHGHDLTPTCVALTGDARYAVSGSKDHSVVLWDIERQTPLSTLCRHWKKEAAATAALSSSSSSSNTKNHKHHKKQYRTAGQVLSVACSDDGKYVAVGKRDATVSIYDVRAAMAVVTITAPTATTAVPRQHHHHTIPLLHQFTGHKGAVTGLAFRTQSHQLFTASDDRCIRHYSLDEMLYMETLYGHQFGITDIDCYLNEQPVSVGRDRTARAWKLAADSHLIFRGGAKVPSADTVTCIQDDWFLTGHDNGVVSLWSTNKKRAVASVELAHGRIDDASATATPPLEVTASAASDATGVGRGVVSIASIKGSDVAATGSHDGYLRFWKVRMGRQDRGLDRMGEIPIPGFINDICFSNINASTEKLFCVAAVGQEHRLGRWERVAGAKNRIAIIQLQHSSETTPAEEQKDEE